MSNYRKGSRSSTPARRAIDDPSGKAAAPDDVAAPSSLSVDTQPESSAPLAKIEATHQSQSLHVAPRLSANVASRRGIFGALLLLVLPILVSAGVAFVGTSRMETVYGAESDILFDLGARADVLEKFLATQAVLARSQAVLSPVSEAFGLSLETLEDNLSIEFLRGSVVMRLSYADKDANRALEVNRAIVEKYTHLLDSIPFIESSRYTLVTARALDEPLWPKPLQATAVGIAVGAAIGIAALALMQALRTGL